MNDGRNDMTAQYARQAGKDGIIAGIYFSAIFISSVLSANLPFLSLLALLMIVGTPFLIFYFLRRNHIANEGRLTFGQLWLEGIATILFGSVILAFVVYVYLRWVNTTFIEDQITLTIGVLNAMGGEQALVADQMSEILADGSLPTPLAMATEMISIAFLTGSILCLVLAPIVKAIKNPRV